MGLKTKITDKRAQIRYDLDTEIQYVLSNSTSQTFHGITIDISGFGVGLYVFDQLHEGQEITVHMTDFRRRGEVRWCREVGENIYRVGIKFL